MRVGTELSVQFVLPGGAAVTPAFSQNMSSQYLQSVAVGPAPRRPAGGRTPVPPKPMPETLPERVLVARLPPDHRKSPRCWASAKAKGFTEVWLHVRLDDPQAAERLTTAQVAGRKLGLALGGAVSLLRGGGMPGTEDINILGETGAAFAKRRGAASPQMRSYYARMADWTLLSPDQATRL